MEQALKPSRFNCVAADENGDLLVFNTLSSEMRKISAQQAKEAQGFLQGESPIPSEMNPDFVRCGFFVNSETDELEAYKAELNRYYEMPVLEISVLPTHQCNCRCVYCFEDFKSGIMTEQTQEALVKFVEDKLPSCSSLRIGWFGGEPLVAMDVIRNLSEKFMSLCKKYRKPYSAAMTTNGTLMTPEIFDELQKYNVISFQITIDGTKTVHDMQRPLAGNGSSYEMVMENLKTIRRNKKGNTFLIMLRINLTKNSLSELESFLCEIDDAFGDDSRFPLSLNVADDWGGERIDSFRENLLTKDSDITSVNDVIQAVIQKKHLRIAMFGTGTGYSQYLDKQPGCYVNKKNFYTVDATGLIYKCAQSIRHNFPPLADLAKYRGLADIQAEQEKWESSLFPEIPKKCENCNLLPLGCWGVSTCPLVKFVRKFGQMPENIEKLCEESATFAAQFGPEPICPGTKKDLAKYLRCRNQDYQPEYIKNIYSADGE